MRRTKIICTLGPATEKTETLRGLLEAGADVFRLNMSHAKHEWVRELVPRVRRIAAELGRPLAILLDTQGPAIRTGELKSNLKLKIGDILEFTVHGAKNEEKYSVDVNYDGLVNDISVGDVVLVDNGVMRLLVLAKKRNRIRCKVLTPGVLGSRRHINLPGVRVNLPPLTEKDLEDIALGVELKTDFVALSFARQRSDLQALRRVLKKAKSSAKVVAKIEDQSAVRNILGMIEEADVVMIARVATHMLESMIENPVPTRAEITDVANAVFEQTDAIMLSGETSTGRYPVECVKVFDRVARRIERSGGAGYGQDAILEDTREKTVASAVVLANSLSRAKIVVFTHHGTMARYASNLRPENAPIFAFTSSETVFRQIVILWGTHPVMLKFADDPNVTIESAVTYLRKQKLTEPGDNLVVLSDMLGGRDKVDSVQLRTAE